MTTTMVEKDLLSKLPLDVRRKVYRYLVAGAHVLTTNSWKKVHKRYHEKYPEDKGWEDPFDTSHIEAHEWPTLLDNRILRTSHKINVEASALLFQESSFWVTYHISDLNRGLPNLDIGDLEANLHRIGDLTIRIKEEDDEPEYISESALGDGPPQLRGNADKKNARKEKLTRGIAPLLERYAAHCTALRRLTVRFEFEKARRREREPRTWWRPMLERILGSRGISRALASFAVKDEVVIKTNIRIKPFYTKEISDYVAGVAEWKGWRAKCEEDKFWCEADADEGPIERWVLTPKTQENEEQGTKRKVVIDDEFVKEFGEKQRRLRAGETE